LIAIPQGPNQRCSLDFLSDAFTDGRRFRILSVVDDFTANAWRWSPTPRQ
jgi:putative transposase